MITTLERDGVVEWSLDREPCNELGLETLDALETAVDAIDPARHRALIVRSDRRAGFSAGADLRSLFARMDAHPVETWQPEIAQFIARIHRTLDRLDRLPITTIAAIHGVCFGGGLELALACDVRIAERSARFAFPELRLGLIPGFGGVPRLRRDCGGAIVRDLLLTGRSLNARRALEVGLVSQLVGAGEGTRAARAMAQQAARFDPEAVARAKSFAKPTLEAELATEREIFLELCTRPAVRDALATFCASTDVRPYLPPPRSDTP